MNPLETITTGQTQMPPRIMIYGPEGVGKSTFAASAPKPIFVQTEDGLSAISTSKFPLCERYEDVVAQLTALRDGEHEFATVCVDSLDWLERLIWDRVCADYGVKSIEKADGGYGKGYVHALSYWREIVKLLNQIRATRAMAVILVAHAKVERFEDPEHPAYDRYQPRLHKAANSLICEWAAAVLFATRRMRVDSTTGKAAPVGADGGERVIRTNGSPAFNAKNRFSLPTEMALSWTAFVEGMKVGSKK
jgi:hypothetical protein